ncbi:MAG TPA: 30S ribosomal protein S16 [Patescibacteria group bacterium]|nr:30S ribosomal protein S16 [Patescibacteria group bacterium]
MLKVKLVRKGKRNLPSFRVEVRDGKKTVESIGSYYPHSARSHFIVSKEKLERWLKAGAQITPAVSGLLKGKYEFKRYVPKKAESSSPDSGAKVTAPEAALATTEESKPVEENVSEQPVPEAAPAVEEKEDESPTPAEEKPNA